MNNKKGFSIFTLFFIDLAFLLVWFLGLAGVVNDIFITASNNWGGSPATGIEAFILYNFNFIILIVFLLFNVVIMYYGNPNQ